MKTPTELMEDAMEIFLNSVSNVISPASPEHIISLNVKIALPDGRAFELKSELKAIKPIPNLIYDSTGNPVQ